MLDLTTIGGKTVILLDVVYKEPSLNDALADAIVAIDADTGDVIQTADGADYFLWLTEVRDVLPCLRESPSSRDGLVK